MRILLTLAFALVPLLVVGCKRPLSFDAHGYAHGTGERIYRYHAGPPRLKEDYVDGKLMRSRWFKPDGSMIQETVWKDGTGEGIYLREDGSASGIIKCGRRAEVKLMRTPSRCS